MREMALSAGHLRLNGRHGLRRRHADANGLTAAAANGLDRAVSAAWLRRDSHLRRGVQRHLAQHTSLDLSAGGAAARRLRERLKRSQRGQRLRAHQHLHRQ